MVAWPAHLPQPHAILAPHTHSPQAALLNQHFASMYKGKLLVRFDDTNPSKASRARALGGLGGCSARRGLRCARVYAAVGLAGTPDLNCPFD